MAEHRPRPLWELTKARFLEFVRDPQALFWVFVFPVLLAVALGIAFRNQGPERTRVALTGAGAAAVQPLVAGIEGTQAETMEPAAAAFRLKTGRVDLVLNADAPPAAGGTVVYRYDPTRPGVAELRHRVDEAIQVAAGRRDAVRVEEVRTAERGGRYIDFLVPGLIGMNIMGSCMWGMGYAIVDARRRKLLKRFAVTPMNRAHFLLSFFLSRLVFLVLEVLVLVACGWLIFGVEVQGSAAAVLGVALLGTAAFSGLALLIASRTDSTEAASGWMNLVQLPMWLLSGSFFAYSRFPDVVHPLIKLLPLTAINDGLRQIVNEGASITAVAPQIALLAAWSLVSFVVALKLFKWQ